jgi:hypothetical protein
MAGHLGDVQRTILNLEVVRVDAERQLLLVKGSVPGADGNDVLVRPAIQTHKPKGPSGKPAPKAAEPKAAKPAAKPEAKPAAKSEGKSAAAQPAKG